MHGLLVTSKWFGHRFPVCSPISFLIDRKIPFTLSILFLSLPILSVLSCAPRLYLNKGHFLPVLTRLPESLQVTTRIKELEQKGDST